MTQYSTRGSHKKRTLDLIESTRDEREKDFLATRQEMLDQANKKNELLVAAANISIDSPINPDLKVNPNAGPSIEETKAQLIMLTDRKMLSVDKMEEYIEDFKNFCVKNEKLTKSGDEKMSNTQAGCNSKSVDIDNSDIYYNNGYQRKVSVLFAGGMKEYVYNCAFKVKKGDLVVVYANGEYKVVTVAATNVDTSFTGRLKDIIDVVDVNRYKALTEAREELQEYRDEQSRAWDLDNQMEDVDRQVEAKVLSKKQSKVVKGLIKKIKSLTD